jgi:hypothetical protein
MHVCLVGGALHNRQSNGHAWVGGHLPGVWKVGVVGVVLEVVWRVVRLMCVWVEVVLVLVVGGGVGFSGGGGGGGAGSFGWTGCGRVLSPHMLSSSASTPLPRLACSLPCVPPPPLP